MEYQPKIIQILIGPNDSTYQGCMFGLGDDGIVYVCPNTEAGWIIYIPAL